MKKSLGAITLAYPTPDCTISRILWAIKRPFSYQALRYLRERQPDLFQQLIVKERPRSTHRYWQAGGGYDRNLFRDETFIKTLNYMHLNPVRKGFVTKPEEWQWSSSQFYLSRKSEDIDLDWTEWW